MDFFNNENIVNGKYTTIFTIRNFQTKFSSSEVWAVN